MAPAIAQRRHAAASAVPANDVRPTDFVSGAASPAVIRTRSDPTTEGIAGPKGAVRLSHHPGESTSAQELAHLRRADCSRHLRSLRREHIQRQPRSPSPYLHTRDGTGRLPDMYSNTVHRNSNRRPSSCRVLHRYSRENQDPNRGTWLAGRKHQAGRCIQCVYRSNENKWPGSTVRPRPIRSSRRIHCRAQSTGSLVPPRRRKSTRLHRPSELPFVR